MSLVRGGVGVLGVHSTERAQRTILVGYCEDVQRRLEQHNAGKVKATKYIRPWRVAYREEHATGTEARQREYYLKSLKSRKVLEELIDAGH